MRAKLENWLLGHWYGTHRPPWYLRSLEPLYRLGFKRSQKRQLANGYRAPVPVIVVGNLTAGGSGKTPVVIRLCQLAHDAGLKAGIATTGYGRRGTRTMEVTAGDDALDCGDEPVMLARRTGGPVVVAEDRLDAVRALADMGLDLVISDDGLQSTSLRRDIELCVVDGERGFGNGRMIPAGPLREPVGRLDSVDHVITNGEWRGAPPGIEHHVMHLDAYVVRSVDEEKIYPVEEFAKMCAEVHVHAFAGIGNSGRFFDMLTGLGFKAVAHPLPDHHAYTAAEFASLEPGSAIIMTEKDAVKCRSFGLDNAWYVPVEARVPEALEQCLTARIAELAGERNDST
jgi:tetraacyldisaccharide 4'-kinase